MVSALCHTRRVALRLAWILGVLLLRAAAPSPVNAAASDAPPPLVEDQLVVADDASDDGGDDPSDYDDGDDDSDDVSLPAAITAPVPRATVLSAAWPLVPLTDKSLRDSLFRPPRTV